ncbi:MAG: nitroreductase family deazaflavin-dependent oxidoreductase [Ktedonobacteraceae bacterium]|jgi:deazaflavin-dependent oxidoreductase (nitroreductase family)
MAKTSQVPRFVRPGNVLMTALVRAGFKVGLIHLLTVRGRKSGQPRTTPIAVVEQNGKRYLAAPYGIVDWVRNLRAAGEAVLTRGRRSETVIAQELPPSEAGLFLQGLIKDSNPFSRYFDVTEQSSLEDFERTALSHPVFLLERK